MHGSHPMKCDATDVFYRGLQGPFIRSVKSGDYIFVCFINLARLPDFCRKITDFYRLTRGVFQELNKMPWRFNYCSIGMCLITLITSDRNSGCVSFIMAGYIAVLKCLNILNILNTSDRFKQNMLEISF